MLVQMAMHVGASLLGHSKAGIMASHEGQHIFLHEQIVTKPVSYPS